MKQEILTRAGIDCEQGLSRCMGDEELFGEILALFLDDHSLEQAGEALDRGDYVAMFPFVHTLKGVCGNLSMTQAYHEASELTELLRDGVSDPVPIKAKYLRLQEACLRAREGIRQAIG